MEEKTITMQPLSGRRRAYDRVLRFLLYFCATLTCALLILDDLGTEFDSSFY